MANTIRLRRGTTTPTAGLFLEGEPAWDSTNSRLYVKNAAGSMVLINSASGGAYTFSATAPSSPASGDQWTNSDDGITYQYLNDGTSSQWVELGPVGISAVTAFSSGSVTAPSVAVGTGTTYTPGIYSPSTDTLAVTTGGVQRIKVDSTGLTLPGATSGNITLAATAVAGTTTLTLPATTGTLVTTGDTGSVTSLMIADGTIVDGDISSTAAIAGSKINPDFGTQNLSTIGTYTARAAATQDGIALQGRAGGTGNFTLTLVPATLSANNTVTIPAGTSTLANLASTQTFSGIKSFNNAAGVTVYKTTATQDGIILTGGASGTGTYRVTVAPASLSNNQTLTLPDTTGTVVTTGDTGSVTSTMLADATIVNGDIATNAAIATSKLANFTAAQVLLGDATGVPTATTLSGDITITSSGVTAIGAGVIMDAEVAANAAIAGTKVAPNFGGQLIQTSQSNQALALTGSLNAANTSNGLFSAGTLGFSGARMGANFASSQTSYYQVVIQNTSSNAGASCDFVVCNDVSTDTSTYGNFGINSSTYTGTGALNAANATYVTSTTGPLVLGSTTAHDLRFVYNSETTDSLTISSATATFGKTLKPVTGTATVAPLQFTSGVNLTSAAAGAMEYDGSVGYFTPDTTVGRGFIPATQTFRLTSAGGAIGNTITNFFGTNSNIPLVANAFYEIDIYMLALRGSTAGPATITLTNSAAPTRMFVDYEASPLAGAPAPPGSVTALTNLYFRGTTTTTTAAYAITTGTLAISVNHYFRLKLLLQNGTGTSLKIQMTAGTANNTMTPQAGSVWFCRRLPDANTGTFAA